MPILNPEQLGSSSGGGGFTLGSPDNIFGASSGDASTQPLSVSPAVDLAAAELTRDTYFTNNPSNLTQYDNNPALSIYVYYQGNGNNIILGQTRVGGEWVPNNSLTVIKGDSDISNVEDGQIPVKSGNILVSSGMQKLGSGQILVPKNFGVESGSVDFGDLVTLSEKGGFLGIDNKQSQRSYNIVDFYSPKDAPARRPQIFVKTESERPLVIQPVDTELINSGPLSFSYTTTLSAYTNAFTLKTSAEMTNVRARVRDNNSGVVLKYYPSKTDWLNGTGVTLPAGVNKLDLDNTPLPLTPGIELDIDIEADNYAILGDVNGVPYFSLIKQDAEFRTLPVDGRLVGITQSISPVTISTNSNIWVAFPDGSSGEEIVINLEDGSQSLDKMVIHYMLNITGNTLRINASSIGFITSSGQLLTDNEITTSTSQRLEFTWGGSRWDLNI